LNNRPNRTDVARSIAYFESTDDLALLQETLRLIRPRAAAAVRRLEASGRAAPPPAEIEAAAAPATKQEALRTLRAIDDFAELQAVSRAIGRRIEMLLGAGLE
jgi:hypothetical protein